VLVALAEATDADEAERTDAADDKAVGLIAPRLLETPAGISCAVVSTLRKAMRYSGFVNMIVKFMR
jgi:hypothetical protein